MQSNNEIDTTAIEVVPEPDRAAQAAAARANANLHRAQEYRGTKLEE